MGEVEVEFRSDLGDNWKVQGTYHMHTNSTSEELQSLICHLLGKEAKLMFLLNGEVITQSLQEHMDKQQLSLENAITIEFAKELPPPEPQSVFETPDWVSRLKITEQGCLVGDFSGNLILYDQDQEKLKSKVHEFALKGLDFNLETKHLMTSSKTGELKVFDADFTQVAYGKVPNSEYLCSSINGEYWVVGGSQGEVHLCRLGKQDYVPTNGTKKQKITGLGINTQQMDLKHTDTVTGLAWPTLDTLYSSSQDRTITSYDFETQRIGQSLLAPRSVQAIAYSSNLLVSGHENGHLQVYDTRNWQKTLSWNGERWIRSLVMKQGLLVAGNEEGKVQIFDTRKPNTYLHEVHSHSNKVLAVDWEGSLIVSGGADAVIKFYSN